MNSSRAGRHLGLVIASAALVVAVPAAARADGATKLHVKGPRGLVVEHRDGPQSKWAYACTTPCDEEVPLLDEYRIDGSDAFRLERTGGDVVTIHALPLGVLMIARSEAQDGWAAGDDARHIGIIAAIAGGIGLAWAIASSGPEVTQVRPTRMETRAAQRGRCRLAPLTGRDAQRSPSEVTACSEGCTSQGRTVRSRSTRIRT